MRDFKVIFWNVWADSQESEARSRSLCERVGQLIDTHKPDVFGLNEVVIDHASGVSKLLEYLRSRGYRVHFTPHGPDRAGVSIGSALVSRRQPNLVREPVLGPDKTAAVHGFPGYEVRAIDGYIPVGGYGASVRVIVNYWAHLMPYNWLAHRTHAKALGQHLASGMQGRTIIGGDFNEFKRMASIKRLGGIYHRATGTLREPTWRWQGKRHLVLRANYDNILWSRDDGLALRDFKVLPIALSDHAPLLGHFSVSV